MARLCSLFVLLMLLLLLLLKDNKKNATNEGFYACP
jgi:hypothetical protein